ncbi:MAG: histidine phosphatase family protein [Chloroflexi bacterium]|nr:histidine phosphatase family protein [Chloroflexota bacterium]
MMLLHLLRHAHAGDPEAWDGPDAARPLSEKGVAQAERLGSFLATIAFKTDAVITSPKVRAARTAEIVAGHLGVAVTEEDGLAGALDLEALEALLARADDPERPVIVGHDPDFSELLSLLCDTENVTMRKGALAKIEVDRPLRAGGGTLRWLIPPDALRPDR